MKVFSGCFPDGACIVALLPRVRWSWPMAGFPMMVFGIDGMVPSHRQLAWSSILAVAVSYPHNISRIKGRESRCSHGGGDGPLPDDGSPRGSMIGHPESRRRLRLYFSAADKVLAVG